MWGADANQGFGQAAADPLKNFKVNSGRMMWQFLAALLPSRPGPRPPLETQLVGPRVILRRGDPADWRSWRAMRELSRPFLVPWEPRWPPNALTYNHFCSLLRRQWREWRQGKGYAFFIFLKNENEEAGALIGGITLSDVHRGIAQKATLGYWVGEPYTARGYMTEAARIVCAFAFGTLQLNRIEASCLPHNEPSKRLLRRLGFEEEGYAKAYLQINGRWEDHLLWGKTSGKDNRV
jgi:ribosomal-protein-alanine N-acetyltransferase